MHEYIKNKLKEKYDTFSLEAKITLSEFGLHNIKSIIDKDYNPMIKALNEYNKDYNLNCILQGLNNFSRFQAIDLEKKIRLCYYPYNTSWIEATDYENKDVKVVSGIDTIQHLYDYFQLNCYEQIDVYYDEELKSIIKDPFTWIEIFKNNNNYYDRDSNFQEGFDSAFNALNTHILELHNNFSKLLNTVLETSKCIQEFKKYDRDVYDPK